MKKHPFCLALCLFLISGLSSCSLYESETMKQIKKDLKERAVMRVGFYKDIKFIEKGHPPDQSVNAYESRFWELVSHVPYYKDRRDYKDLYIEYLARELYKERENPSINAILRLSFEREFLEKYSQSKSSKFKIKVQKKLATYPEMLDIVTPKFDAYRNPLPSLDKKE